MTDIQEVNQLRESILLKKELQDGISYQQEKLL